MHGTAWTGKAAGLKLVQTTDLSLVKVNHRLCLGSNNSKKISCRNKSILDKFIVTRCVWFQMKMTQIILSVRKHQYNKTHAFQMRQEMENSSHAYSMLYRLVYSSLWLEYAGISPHLAPGNIKYPVFSDRFQLQTYHFHTSCLCSQPNRHSGKNKKCPGHKSHHAGRERSCKL